MGPCSPWLTEHCSSENRFGEYDMVGVTRAEIIDISTEVVFRPLREQSCQNSYRKYRNNKYFYNIHHIIEIFLYYRNIIFLLKL